MMSSKILRGLKSASTIGQRLRLALDYLNLKQVAFAEKVGCTQAFISMVLHDRSGPSTGILSALELLNISPSWLMTGQGSMLSTKSTSSTSDPSESLSVADGPCSSPPHPTITIELPPDVSAGDTLLIRIERREHPLALIGKIIYTVPRK